MITAFQQQILKLEREINRLIIENNTMRSALEDIAKDYDPKQTWVTVAVERRLIARRALDKLNKTSTNGD